MNALDYTPDGRYVVVAVTGYPATPSLGSSSRSSTVFSILDTVYCHRELWRSRSYGRLTVAEGRAKAVRRCDLMNLIDRAYEARMDRPEKGEAA